MILIGPTLPPVTGERLCRQLLAEELPAATGARIDAVRNNDWLALARLAAGGEGGGGGDRRRGAGRGEGGDGDLAGDRRAGGRRVWLLPGAGAIGTWRDALAMLMLRPATLYLHFHNASFGRFSRLAPLLGLFGERVVFVALTRVQTLAVRRRRIAAFQLRNTVRAAEVETPAPKKRRLIWLGAISAEKGFDVAYAAFRLLAAQAEEDAKAHAAPGAHANTANGDRANVGVANAEAPEAKAATGAPAEAWTFDVYGNADAALRERCWAATFRGFAGEADKPGIWAGGGIFVLPSRYKHETQPLAIVEAMAAGVPTVATDIGGIAEMLEPQPTTGAPGIVVPANVDAERLKVALDAAYNHHETLSRAALACYARRFSIGVFRERLRAAVAVEKNERATVV